MGANIDIEISDEGSAVVGIQINGLPSTDYIKGIWLSPRTITDNSDGTAEIGNAN
jgi:hypothetical protein